MHSSEMNVAGSIPEPLRTVPTTNTLAIVSFVSSFFVGLVGIITGHIALKQMRQRPQLGRGFALAGLIIGYIATAIVLALVLLSVVFASAFTALLLMIGSAIDNPSSLSVVSVLF